MQKKNWCLDVGRFWVKERSRQSEKKSSQKVLHLSLFDRSARLPRTEKRNTHLTKQLQVEHAARRACYGLLREVLALTSTSTFRLKIPKIVGRKKMAINLFFYFFA